MQGGKTAWQNFFTTPIHHPTNLMLSLNPALFSPRIMKGILKAGTRKTSKK